MDNWIDRQRKLVDQQKDMIRRTTENQAHIRDANLHGGLGGGPDGSGGGGSGKNYRGSGREGNILAVIIIIIASLVVSLFIPFPISWVVILIMLIVIFYAIYVKRKRSSG